MDTWSALIGVLLGWGLGWWQERKRWFREDRTRFREVSRDIYVRFLANVDRMLLGAEDAAAVPDELAAGPDNFNELEAVLAQASPKAAAELSSLLMLYREVTLVASEPALSSAKTVVGAATHLRVFLGLAPKRPEGVRQKCASLREAQETFLQEARTELGMAHAS